MRKHRGMTRHESNG